MRISCVMVYYAYRIIIQSLKAKNQTIGLFYDKNGTNKNQMIKVLVKNVINFDMLLSKAENKMIQIKYWSTGGPQRNPY